MRPSFIEVWIAPGYWGSLIERMTFLSFEQLLNIGQFVRSRAKVLSLGNPFSTIKFAILLMNVRMCRWRRRWQRDTASHCLQSGGRSLPRFLHSMIIIDSSKTLSLSLSLSLIRCVCSSGFIHRPCHLDCPFTCGVYRNFFALTKTFQLFMCHFTLKNGPFPASFSLFSSFQYSWQ